MNNSKILSYYPEAVNEETQWHLAKIQKYFTTQTTDMYNFLN